ncbi:hypothetical protein [Planktotalea arctica]|uniref:hypothetical protein n=1 Tax=Planktotalea arctica TaxID=1481893 RepID=UPI00321B3202
MKPNFTLSLSFSGIQLLHRQNGAWGRVGDVDLSTDDLTRDLSALLDKAHALGGGPIETKLIIPDDQIKYLTVDVTGLDKSEVQSTVLGALDGATPYAVNELEFDFFNEEGSVYIAAVAKETLREAEAFASEHGFTPMGFIAAPPTSKFPIEPNFGLSELAKSQGRAMLETDDIPAIASGDAVAITPVPEAKPAPETEPAEIKTPRETAPQQMPEPIPAAPALGFSSRRAAPADQNAAPEIISGKDASPLSGPRLEGVKRGQGQALPTATSALSSAVQPTVPLAKAPEITGRSQVALDEEKVDSSVDALRPAAAIDEAAFDDIPPMPAGFAAAPRASVLRGASDGATIPDLHAPGTHDDTAPAAFYPDADDRSDASPTESTARASAVIQTGLAWIKGFFAKSAQPAPTEQLAGAAPPSPPDEEKQRMTVFGARKPKAKKEPAAIGGKPRFLGLILTAILLLFLVTVAAWASVFLDNGLARFFGSAERERAIAQLPDPGGTRTPAEVLEIASLDAALEDLAIEDQPPAQQPLRQVEPAPPLISPEEAAAKYAATGIWLAAPPQPLSPVRVPLDDVYLASIDARITGQDAFALEPLAQHIDLAPRGSGAPPPAGTGFAFDDDGLVIATPEGAITPEGALVFLGRPTRVPPAIPERLRSAALVPDETSEPVVSEAQSVANLPALRPRLRPDALIENTERTQLGGNTLVELSKLRPKLRPSVEKEIEETAAAEAPATRLAVASSRAPNSRPGNFARIVSRAQNQSEAQPEQEATQVAALAPRSVTPRVPSSTSVAKAATVKNAINLSRVNLIGVYGKPSSRRALVRLATGRYKKVKVGDRVDGGRVSAIGEEQLIYTKSGRNVTLRMPKG